MVPRTPSKISIIRGPLTGVAVFAVGIAAAAGCGSSGGPRGLDPAVCNAYVEAFQAFNTCWRYPGYEPWPNALEPGQDGATFAAVYCGDFSKAPGAASLGDELRACSAWLRSTAACTSLSDAVDPSCLLRGTLAAGAACVSGVQCQSGVCNGSGGVSCGTCAPLVGRGQPCDGPVPSVCDVGLTCLLTPTSVCTPYLKEGESCNPNAGGLPTPPCVPLLYCDHLSSICQKPPGPGEACDPQGPCAAGAFCMSSTTAGKPPPTGTCVMPPTGLAEGDACDQGGSCAEGLYCPASGVGDDGGTTRPVCTKIPIVGAGTPCGGATSTPVQCDTGLQCNNQICFRPGGLGEACSDSIPCNGWLSCSGGTCRLPDASVCR